MLQGLLALLQTGACKSMWTPFRTCNSRVDAELLVGLLETAQIPSRITSGDSGGITPHSGRGDGLLRRDSCRPEWKQRKRGWRSALSRRHRIPTKTLRVDAQPMRSPTRRGCCKIWHEATISGCMLQQRFKLAGPLILAPMAGGPTTPELVAAACEAGAFGVLDGAYRTPTGLASAIARLRALTQRPFGINLYSYQRHRRLWMKKISRVRGAACSTAARLLGAFEAPLQPPYTEDFEQQFAVVLQHKPAVFSFTFGIADPRANRRMPCTRHPCRRMRHHACRGTCSGRRRRRCSRGTGHRGRRTSRHFRCPRPGARPWHDGPVPSAVGPVADPIFCGRWFDGWCSDCNGPACRGRCSPAGNCFFIVP